MKNDNMNAPEIRFPGFTDPWEQRKLGDVVGVYDGTHQTPDYKDQGVMFVSVENIQTLTSDKYISEEDYEKNYSVVPEVGDILMTRIGDIGTANIVKSPEPLAYYVSLALLKNAKLNAEYLKSNISAPAFQNELWLRTLHTAYPKKINKEEIGKCMISIAPQKREQEQIGCFFENLDNLITLHQRKCDELKIYKKGLLQQMFPQPGEAFPHVRFPGFTDPWEQRKFGDIGSVSMCKRIFKEETSVEGDIPFYKIGTFGSEPDAFISRELFEDYKSRFSYPEEGAILLSASGTIGRIVEYKGEEAYFQDSNIVWLSHDKSVSNKFLKVLYPTVKWDGIEGSTIQRLYNDNFLKTQFMMPNLPEQEKLGDFFEGVDNLITLHQRKCDELKNYKKGLLQKMFV